MEVWFYWVYWVEGFACHGGEMVLVFFLREKMRLDVVVLWHGAMVKGLLSCFWYRVWEQVKFGLGSMLVGGG